MHFSLSKFGQIRIVPVVVFCTVMGVGGHLRFSSLGARSLWSDEFCTWKVSQMPLRESLVWQPELTKPPLYQLALRAIQVAANSLNQGESSPLSEWQLRLPAAVCGLLAVAAMWWLGAMAGGWTLGAAAALLLAVNGLQIDYSQEARPYSMLMLGSVLSTGTWYRLNGGGNKATSQQGREAPRQEGKWGWALAYVVVTTLTFYANYVIVLTICAQVLWALVRAVRHDISDMQTGRWMLPAGAVICTAFLCLPMALHFLRHRLSVFQGLDWIVARSSGGPVTVLREITFGEIWVICLLLPAISIWVIRQFYAMSPNSPTHSKEQLSSVGWGNFNQEGSFERNLVNLLVAWLFVAWGGLLIISWTAHPLMVARYALPATAPAILLPLMMLQRWDWRLPLVVAGVFAVGTAPTWATRAERIEPGFREMVTFLDEYAVPRREAVVMAIERTTSPGWEEMDLLGFEYYQSSRFEDRNPKTSGRKNVVEVLYMRNGKPDGDQPILRDPRALWVVAFLADPIPSIEAAGRKVQPIEFGGNLFEQLYFKPYRLIRVAEQ